MPRTIGELARDLSVPVTWVKSHLRAHGAPGEDYRPKDKRISAADERGVREAYARGELATSLAHVGDQALHEEDPEPASPAATSVPLPSRLLEVPASVGGGAGGRDIRNRTAALAGGSEGGRNHVRHAGVGPGFGCPGHPCLFRER